MRPVVLLLSVLLLAVPASASWEQEPRNVVATWDRTSFSITSSAAGNESDVITWHFDAAAASLTVTADVLGGHGTWTLGWTSLVEFQDLDENGAYNLGDPIVQQIRFEDMQLPVVRVEQDGAQRVATVTYRHPDTFQQLVALRFRVVPESPLEGPVQDPTTLLTSVTVEGFAFETDNHTRLAIEQRWAATMRPGADAVERTQGPILMRHAWDASAEVDGAPATADTTIQSYARDKNGETIILTTVPRGQAIEHDCRVHILPAAGAPPMTILETITGSWPLFVAGILVAGVIVAYPLLRRGGG